MARERIFPVSGRVVALLASSMLLGAAGWGIIIIEAQRDGDDSQGANSPDAERTIEPTFSPADTLLIRATFTPVPEETVTATGTQGVETGGPTATELPLLVTPSSTLITPPWTLPPTAMPTSPWTPEPTVPPTPEPTLTIVEGLNYYWSSRLVELFNSFRQENGLNVLSVNDFLIRAAEKYSKLLFGVDIDQRGHYLDGSPSDRAQREGYNGVAGEVLGSSDPLASNPQDFMQGGWVNSPGHKEVILTKDVRDVGIGCYQGFYKNVSNVIICVVDLGVPSQ